jgi:2,4-dienoyl-CoA reductase-like NADH-dependent reductase (Old Yellow Enzyme family)
VKLNSADFLRGGFSAEDAVIVARTLSEEGVDLLEVSGGTYERPEMAVPTRASTAAREAHFLSFARQIRGVISCPIMLTGGVRTPSLMAEIVGDGSVDVIGLARPLALEPDLPREILEGRERPSRCDAPRGRLQVLNAAVDNAWYQAQLQRMGRGREPDRELGRIRPVLEAARRFLGARRTPSSPPS